MHCDHRKHWTAITPTWRALLLAGLAVALAERAAATVRFNVTSASVSRGGTAKVCVSIDPQEPVAGTQNDIVWDPSQCDVLSCTGVGSHGKSVTPGAPNASGGSMSMHVLVLSITDVKPIPAGPLYCCDVRANETCNVGFQGVLGASPDGARIGGSGGVAVVSVSDTGRGGGGGGGGGGPAPGPLSAVGGATGGQAAAPSGGGVRGGPGGVSGGLAGQQQPPAVVVPGGVPGEIPAGAVPGQQAQAGGQVQTGGGQAQPAAVVPTPIGGFPPTPSGEFAPTPIGGFPATPGGEAASEAAATAALAAPTTAAAAQGTATKRPTLQRPTLRPTQVSKPVVAPKAEEKKGWFGCQVVSGGADGSGLVILGLLGFVALRVRRRG